MKKLCGWGRAYINVPPPLAEAGVAFGRGVHTTPGRPPRARAREKIKKSGGIMPIEYSSTPAPACIRIDHQADSATGFPESLFR